MSRREQLWALMCEEASRGGASYGSDKNHAMRVGACRATVHRWKCEFIKEGRCQRDGYHVFGPRCKTVRYRLRVTQEGLKFRTTRTTPCSRGPRRACASDKRGRRRRFMERHPQRLGEGGIVRADGSVTPANAGDAVAIVIDWFRAKGIPITRQAKGMVARQAKTLLEDGFDFDTVVKAAILAIRRGGPHLMHYIASDLAAAQVGEWIPDRNDYRKKLEDEIELRRDEIRRMLRENEDLRQIYDPEGDL